MQEVDKWLDGVLADMPEESREEAKRQIRAKVLESYHNGRDSAGAKAPQQQERPQEPRKGRYNNQRKQNYGR